MSHIEAMKQALEALENLLGAVEHNAVIDPVVRYTEENITSLRQAIEQAEKQEPLVWLCEPDENGMYGLPLTEGTCTKCFPVYKSPQPQKPWVGLTDEQVFEIIKRIDPSTQRLPKALKQLARAIEAAHNIK